VRVIHILPADRPADGALALDSGIGGGWVRFPRAIAAANGEHSANEPADRMFDQWTSMARAFCADRHPDLGVSGMRWIPLASLQKEVA
jgi:hypothetical protein